MSVDSHVGKVGNISTQLLLDDWNEFFSLSDLNLRLDVSLYILLNGLPRRSSISSPLGVFDSVSEVFKGLINFPVTGGVHGLLFSLFSDKKFNSSIFFRIPKVFQEDIPLSGVLLELGLFVSPEIVSDDQLLALTNFRIPIGSWRSSSFGRIVYTKINSATSPDEDVLSNPLVF